VTAASHAERKAARKQADTNRKQQQAKGRNNK